MAEYQNDATLLERFVDLREEDAFVALVRRHGPAVLSVCRRFLRSEHDVEDVFQSTFLILALKAPGIAWQESAEGWLRDVARRLALHARSGVARRRSRERSLTPYGDEHSGCDACSLLEESPEQAVERSDLKRALDDALDQLPEKYRAPVVLCYLEGKTNEEAARQLGWPAGSMSRRLERGRTLLRQRLARHGLVLSLGIVCLGLVLFQGVVSITRNAIASRDPLGPIRGTMTSFKPQGQDREGFEHLLSRLTAAEPTRSDRDQAVELADLASKTATIIEDFDPGRDKALWRNSASEMRRSAIALGQSARTGDGLAMVTAARGLDATCVRCHAWFRPQNPTDRSTDGSGVWSKARWLDKMN